MPNFPSVYLELQQLWKKINDLNNKINSIENKITNSTCDIGIPVEIIIPAEDWEVPIEIPITSCFIIINYQRSDMRYVPSLQTSNITVGKKVTIMSSMDSNESGYFSWRSPGCGESPSNVYQGYMAYGSTSYEDTEKKFYPGSVAEFLYVGNNKWLMTSHMRVYNCSY